MTRTLKKAQIKKDPLVEGVIARRYGTVRPGRIETNIDQMVVSHSPDGFEWGYAGSGPADFALNILHLFLPPKGDDTDVAVYDGVVSQAAWDLHQPFKLEFIASMPLEGRDIPVAEIKAWIEQQLREDA